MSRDVIVLAPNGRRQKVHCTPDTIILQVLEDVCQKQGFQSTEYDLKHHNHILDLTTSIRFSNLPNKATLEMVEAERKRQESNVTIGLLLEDGDRRTADFSPNTSLFDIVTSLAPSELNAIQNPTILYMRQEVIGIPALQQKTLRQLGLLGGRAILRLLNKLEEAMQANVSSVYRKSQPEKEDDKDKKVKKAAPLAQASTSGPSKADQITDHKVFNPIQALRIEKSKQQEIFKEPEILMDVDLNVEQSNKVETTRVVDQSNKITKDDDSKSLNTENLLERRLKIEEEVTFLGTQKAIAFMQPDGNEHELEDLPDDFYELTIEEVRKLYHELQKYRSEVENTPLITASKKEEIKKQTSNQKINTYKNVVVRIQFPDGIILQGVFIPTDTIEDVNSFVKEHLQTPERSFHIYTTPLNETLNPKQTLLEAKFVPCVHMHFKWLEETSNERYLKDEIYLKKTSSDAATILASKYRAPSRRKLNESSDSSQKSNLPTTSTAKSSKVPKWFK